MNDRVWAVVVTYNRKALLRECLSALHVQSHPLARILIVDNASADGTAEMLQQEFLGEAVFEYTRLDRNLGGAGGFHQGMRHAYEAGAEWIWVLDDDTILAPDALEQLLVAKARFGREAEPDLLSSRVVWTDGTPHPMNIPWFKQNGGTADNGVGNRNKFPSLRATTFVAALIRRQCIERFGLPLADYFIWSDDIEYTARILRAGRGIVVPASLATHKTPEKHSALGAKPERFYYHVRNTIWMLTRSSAFSWREALPQFISLALVIQSTIRRSRAKRATFVAVLRAFRDAVMTRPRK